MLRALGLQGRDALRQLRGMFAIAFWDSRDRKLVIARDPFGIKPLYFARNPDARGDWSLVFASEVRAILASGLLGTPKLNPRAVASIVWSGFVVSPETAVVGIETVWPGQLRVFDTSGKEELSEYYWSASRKDSAAIDEPPPPFVAAVVLADLPATRQRSILGQTGQRPFPCLALKPSRTRRTHPCW